MNDHLCWIYTTILNHRYNGRIKNGEKIKFMADEECSWMLILTYKSEYTFPPGRPPEIRKTRLFLNSNAIRDDNFTKLSYKPGIGDRQVCQ
jgi:hypothetical protein